jgi:hypothetical protein
MSALERSWTDKPQLKIQFTDFWEGFNPDDNYFTTLLSSFFDVKTDSANPDILFFSCFGKDFLQYACPRIFYTGENVRPRLFDCDFALGFDYSANPRIIRFPIYLSYSAASYYALNQPKNIEHIIQQKTKFCSFVVSNPDSNKRAEFFRKLSKYKKVDSGGKYLNNIGYAVDKKQPFIKPYKFNISFENASYPGYTTEKIVEAMAVNTVPVYWGNPLINREFNVRSFVNWHDYGSDEAVIERIIELDRNGDKYRKVVSESWFSENQPNPLFEYNEIQKTIVTVVKNALLGTPVAQVPSCRAVSRVYNMLLRPAYRRFKGLLIK